MQAAEAATEQWQYLTFDMIGEEYAVGILRVQEIIEYDTVTRVPRMPPFIRGVINLRGRVVPVIDLGVKFGLPASEPTQDTCIVILELSDENDRRVVGVVTDAVNQVIDLAEQDIEAPPTFGTSIRADFLLGMAPSPRGFLLILDIDRLLSLEEILSAADVAEEAGTEADAGEDAQSEDIDAS